MTSRCCSTNRSNGLSESAPLGQERANDLARTMDSMLKPLGAFTRFMQDDCIRISNDATERTLRGISVGRKSWLFSGSDRDSERAATMFTRIQGAKLNNTDPQAWLAEHLGRIAHHKIADLVTWN